MSITALNAASTAAALAVQVEEEEEAGTVIHASLDGAVIILAAEDKCTVRANEKIKAAEHDDYKTYVENLVRVFTEVPSGCNAKRFGERFVEAVVERTVEELIRPARRYFGGGRS